MKELKDYLHLYLGCAVELDIGGGSKVYNRKLVAFGGIEDELYCKLRLGPASKGCVHAVLLKDKSVKPILRRLESITDDELITVFKSISLFDLSECQFECGFGKEERWINAIKDGSVVDAIEYNGHLFYTMNNDGTFDPVNPQWEVAALLLKMNFDLFGLIDSGLAIDSTTLNHAAG